MCCQYIIVQVIKFDICETDSLQTDNYPHQEMLTQIIVYTIIAIFIGISQSAGIGGGPILNICLMVGLGYSSKQSMSITYVFLMGGAAASMVKSYKKLREKENKLVMDYDMILITMPMTTSGSLIGTLINHYVSELVITILFTILLTYLSYNTYIKLKNYSNFIQEQKAASLLHKEQELFSIYQQREVNPHLQKILDDDLDPLPKQKLKQVLFIFFYTLLVLLWKGGENYKSMIGLESCGIGSFILIIFHIMLSYICSKSSAMEVFEKQSEMERYGYVFQKESDKISSKSMWSFIISGFCAGMIGGALGLGGAIVLVPVWLNMGIDKDVATSSSAPLIFFSALTSFCMSLLAGMYDNNAYLLAFYFVLAFAGAAIVKSFVIYLSEKYHLHLMIFVLLLITMLSSLLVLLPFQISKFYLDPEGFTKFGRFC